MYPEDRVLVGVMPNPRDLELARDHHWYRIPARRATQGVRAEYVAFYFTKAFSPDLRWGIHFFARRTGHELVRRAELLPDEPDHPHADELYYKLQLGPLRRREQPIVSLRWRRITFIHTTWDRFTAAREINDLFSTDDVYVDRVYHALKERGIQPERAVEVHQGRETYTADLMIPCRDGAVMLTGSAGGPPQALCLPELGPDAMADIDRAMQDHGGPLMIDATL
jgi:hypothetical protein